MLNVRLKKYMVIVVNCRAVDDAVIVYMQTLEHMLVGRSFIYMSKRGPVTVP